MVDTVKVSERLRLVQSELKVAKGQRNTFGNYDYRSAEDIVEAAKPVLLANGLMLLMSDEIVLIGERYYLKARAAVYDADGNYVDAYAYAREASEKKGMDSAQVTGATSSYARKYALNGLFAIDDSKDADSDEHKNESDKQSDNDVGQSADDIAKLAYDQIVDELQDLAHSKGKDSNWIREVLSKYKTMKELQAVIAKLEELPDHE